MMNPNAQISMDERARRLQLMAFDIDGTLTDGTIRMGSQGELYKNFSVHDGLGLVWLREAGIEVAFITGRSSAIVAFRAQELQVSVVMQGVGDKAQALRQLCTERGISLGACGFMGDDYPDLPALRIAGLAATVPGAPTALQEAAHWQATRAAGQGAARELAELILHARGDLDRITARFDGRQS